MHINQINLQVNGIVSPHHNGDSLIFFFFFTSNDAEKLLDPHVDVDAAEELLHMTAPALEDGTTNVI